MPAPHLINIAGYSIAADRVGYPDTATMVDAHFGAGYIANSTAALNDYIEWPVYLAAGTWDLLLIHLKVSNGGIFTVSLNGSTVSNTIDSYNATTTYDNEGTESGITVASDGIYDLRFTMASKNASSSAYQGIIQHISMIRTGA